MAYFYFPVFSKFISSEDLVASPKPEARFLGNLMLRNILCRTFSRGVGHGTEKYQMRPGFLSLHRAF